MTFSFPTRRPLTTYTPVSDRATYSHASSDYRHRQGAQRRPVLRWTLSTLVLNKQGGFAFLV